MGKEAPFIAIARLRSTWDNEVTPSARRALVALSFATLFGAAHVARIGSPLARALAAGALVGVLVFLLARAVVLRRRRNDVRQIVRQTIAKTDAALGAATLRAVTLVERTAVDDRIGSPALASLHLTRLLNRASSDRIAGRAARAARAWAGASLALAVLAFVTVVFEPFRIVEGLDVLVARDGEAPLKLEWLDAVDMVAKPPEYLHVENDLLLPFSPTEQPRGTSVSVRGRPVHPGRALVLTDGRSDVPFVDDGQQGLVARWTLGDTTELFVAAKFGAVRIRQADAQRVASIPDELPVVRVEGAPRTVRLLDEPSIPIHYEVTDDHGLREVNLVLRSGTREERRVLSRPAAEAKTDRGGYEIQAKDAFFKRTFAPVSVTVEARDNDPITGPKWGKSEAILVVLPLVGEPEALRYEAMAKARDALTDLLADRLSQKPPSAKEKAEHTKHEAQVHASAVTAVESALSQSYGGLRLRGRSVSLARGQLRRLTQALDEERKSATGAKHDALVTTTEDVLLAFDSAVRGLGIRDSRLVAGRLADVADELAAAANAAGAASPGAEARLDASTQVLEGGGKQLLRLGELGLDLGEIVANDLRRIARARQAKDMVHAELAARDLAARLRSPDPSFGGGGRGGVESGGPPSPDSSKASSADEDMMAGEQELEEIARDHAAEMNEVTEALEKAVSKEELEQLREEAKKHAEAIREAIKDLPEARGDTDSAEASAAAGREQAESMAGALEQGTPEGAVKSGREALRSLAEAKRRGEQNESYFPEKRAGQAAAEAHQTIERELAWVEEALEKLRSRASERAKEELSRSSKDEEALAERSKRLMQKGDSGDSSMPQEMLDRLSEAEQAMRDAERSLREGKGEEGLKHQENAQRLLEMARGEQSEDNPREDGAESDEGKMQKKADIPGKEKHKGPDDFRRRVLEGLGGSADPVLKDAVKRYAEGLLR